MTVSRSTATAITLVLAGVLSAHAADIDMDDPYRAVGRENDVRVDARLISDVVKAGTPIAVTYQVQNLSRQPVAVAEKVCAASYDADSQTITLAVGSEIPPDGHMPKMVTIAPGEKKTFTTAANLHVALPAATSRFSAIPRFLQIKVSVLRNVAPFRELLARQQEAKTAVTPPLDDRQFDQWLEGNDTIFLNALPIRYESRGRGNFDASAARPSRGGM